MVKEPEQDSNFISHFNQRFSVQPFFSNKTFKLNIADLWLSGHDIIYTPNVSNRLGLAGSYKSLSIGFSLALPSNEFIYGKTQSFVVFLNTQLSFMNLVTDFYFVRNKGFYLNNPVGNIAGWQNGSPYPTEPKLAITNIGLSTQMVFSQKFSMKAAIYQSEKQRKSAGGFSLGAALRYSGFSTDSTMIPLAQQKFYADILTLKSGGFLTIAIAPGYSYTFVYKDFFVSGTLLIGLGLQPQIYQLEPKKSKFGFKFTNYSEYRIGGGYNSDIYFGSISYNFYNNKTIIKDSKLIMTYNSFTLSVGMRFK